MHIAGRNQWTSWNPSWHNQSPEQSRLHYDQILGEVVRVQRDDPLGRRNLLVDVAGTLKKAQPQITSAIISGLNAIPENPGFGVEGAMANKAEQFLLDAVGRALSRPVSGPPGPQPRQMMWRLLRLGMDNVSPHVNHPEETHEAALLSWRLLQAVAPLTSGSRPQEIVQQSARPPSQPNLPNDLSVVKKNREMIDEVFGKERTYEYKGHHPGDLGR